MHVRNKFVVKRENLNFEKFNFLLGKEIFDGEAELIQAFGLFDQKVGSTSSLALLAFISLSRIAANVKKAKKKCVLNEDDWVWFHLGEEAFLKLGESNLGKRVHGKLCVKREFIENAIPSHLQGKNSSSMIMLSDSFLFKISDSRTNPFKGGGSDANQIMHVDLDDSAVEPREAQRDLEDVFASVEGPIIRDRLQKLQKELQAYLVQLGASDSLSKPEYKLYNLWGIYLGAEQDLVSL